MEIILPYIYDPSKLQEGGGLRYTHNLVNYLLDTNHKVSLLGVKLSEKQTYIHPNFRFIPILQKSEAWWKYFLKLILKAPFFKFPKSALIHTQRTYFMLPFILFYPTNPKICTLHMKPLEFVKVHYPLYFCFIDQIHKIVDNFCLKRTDVLIAINDNVKNSYVLRYPNMENKIQVVFGTGVDLENLIPLDKKNVRNEYEFLEDGVIILFVGRFEKIKNIDFLLRSFVIFCNEITNSKLVLVGRGSEQSHLESLVDELGLKENVLFLGEISPDEISKIYNCSDLLAISSYSESSPTVLREALACGIPVVSTNVGDVCEIITNPLLGAVIDNYDEKDFAEALVNVAGMVKDNSEKSKIKCREMAQSRFGFEKIGEQIVEIYKNVL